MSIIRIIQESDLMNNRSMFSLKTVNTELGKMDEIIKEKDVIIQNNCERIQEMEAHIVELEGSLQKSLREKRDDEILVKYNKFIHDIMTKHETVMAQRNVICDHLACLETGFADLVTKYERLKTILAGYQANQAVLVDRVTEQVGNIEVLQQRYDKLKSHTNDKLREANAHVANMHRKHAEEIASVKIQLQGQKDKITELEQSLADCRGEAPVKKKLLPSIINTFKFY
ncbi:hypothetical protein PPYR_06533 [Photinus pyralis]|uniref:Transforming acidic coiled-coil-containing protein C-terminal domain-containing protein n=1 Tax=Photinus pyralis TaxID=7054 RepID=A0A5N4ATX8_PHOPY|nr:uncharacterized protein LOC116166965 [Photinus pyralis]XP_031339234.1 uncharacterized protein LOC116167830 [Photinus pyralis]KAB0800794.1 hypothetical protein PPYR_06533 [Photinus pyralis]